MFELEAIAVGVLLPAAIAAVVLVIGLIASRDEPSARDSAIYIAGAVAIVCAFALVFEAISNLTLWPDEFREWHWLPVAALTVAVLGIARALRWLPAWLYWIAQALAIFGFSWPFVPGGWPEADAWRCCAAFAIGAVALANIVLLQSASSRNGGPLLPALMMCNYVAAAVAVECFSFASMVQLAVAVAVVMGVLAVFAWLYPQRFVFRGAAPVAGLLLPAMLIQAWFNTFDDIPGWPLLLIALGPLGTALLALVTANARWRALAIAASLLLPTIGAAWLVTASLMQHSAAGG